MNNILDAPKEILDTTCDAAKCYARYTTAVEQQKLWAKEVSAAQVAHDAARGRQVEMLSRWDQKKNVIVDSPLQAAPNV